MQPQPAQEGQGCKPKSYRALTEEQRQEVLDTLHSERFVDMSPAAVFATLLDEGVYLCSISTMYRILRKEHGQVRDRRNQLKHPKRQATELLALGPNEVWTWDITKLKGPATWTYYYLYVMIDIYSRYVVGWMLASRESASLAEQFIRETVEKHRIPPGQLTIHSDLGPAMTSKPVAALMGTLGITKTHSRPYTSSDNPFSEAQFKTLKYCPSFPGRFGCYEDTQAFCHSFFAWYNHEHMHSGIGLMPPAALHLGKAEQLVRHRNEVLAAAFRRHPERFVNKHPEAPPVPVAAWINPPKRELQSPISTLNP